MPERRCALCPYLKAEPKGKGCFETPALRYCLIFKLRLQSDKKL